MVEEYLDVCLPESWDIMDLYERRNFLADHNAPTSPRGMLQREFVSNAEIWTECLGRSFGDLKPADSYSLAALMLKVSGWERTIIVRRLPIYGRQRLYRRSL